MMPATYPTHDTEPPSTSRPTPADHAEFRDALQDYRVSSGRMFPTWSEVLEVLKDLGYQKAENAQGKLRAS